MTRITSNYLIVVGCVTASVLHAQDKADHIHVGLYGGSQLVHINMPERGNVIRPSSPPGWAWGGGIIAGFALAKKVNAAFSAGLVTEKAKMEGEYSAAAFSGAPPIQFESEEVFSWLEFSTSIFFKPIQKPSYSVLWGIGLSARNQMNAYMRARMAGTRDYGSAIDLSGYTYQWNYTLPLQGGVEFQLNPRHKIVCLAGFQFGLRALYTPMESSGVALFDDGFYKVNSTTLRVIYLFGGGKKSGQ